MTFIIKQATIENIDEISKLYDEYRISDNQKSDLNGVKSFLSDCFKNKESIIFYAVEAKSNNLIGFTQLFTSFASISMKRSLILNDLYVCECSRNQGVAKLLLDAVKSYAIQVKAYGIGLTTEINNDNAQRLYEKNGYKKDLSVYQYYMDINQEMVACSKI